MNKKRVFSFILVLLGIAVETSLFFGEYGIWAFAAEPGIAETKQVIISHPVLFITGFICFLSGIILFYFDKG